MDPWGRNERSLSVVCADLTGRAPWSHHLGSPEGRHALGRCEKRIRRAVEGRGGRLLEGDGSKWLAFFPDPLDALQSAIDMQRRIADLPPFSGIPMAIRVGVCAGHDAKEERFFPSDGTNPAITLAAVAGPGKILMSVPRRAKPFPWSALAADIRPDLALQCGQRQLGILDVPWEAPAPLALHAALVQLAKGEEALRVRYRDQDLVLSASRPVLRIGRQAECDLAVRDQRCSRVHGTLERRGEQVYLVDRSANGTYVRFAGRSEILVQRRELLLAGRGLLSLGAPAGSEGVEQVLFDFGDPPR